MIFIRSLIFNIAFYALLIIFLIVGLPTILGPRMWSIRALQLWGHTMNWLLRVICNIKVEVRGLEKIPQGACIVAGKHQSVWETFAATTFVDDPCMVLKKS